MTDTGPFGKPKPRCRTPMGLRPNCEPEGNDRFRGCGASVCRGRPIGDLAEVRRGRTRASGMGIDECMSVALARLSFRVGARWQSYEACESGMQWDAWRPLR